MDPLNNPEDVATLNSPEFWESRRNGPSEGALHPKIALELILKLRRRIDDIDDKLTALFDASLRHGKTRTGELLSARLSLVVEITAIKTEQDWPLYDEIREAEIRNRLMLIGRGEHSIDRLMTLIRDRREGITRHEFRP